MSTSDQNLSAVQLASVLAQVEVSQQRLGAFASKATSQTMASTADLAGDMNKQANVVRDIGTALAILGPAVMALGGISMGVGAASMIQDGIRNFLGSFGMIGIYGAQGLATVTTGALGATQDVYKSKVSLDQSAATTVQKSGQQIVKAAQTNQQTSASLARTEGDLVKSTDVKTN